MADDLDRAQYPRQKIGRQIVLPFSKAFEIAWKGIRIRIWRSLITMSGIILAIAFLMSVWTSSVFSRALGRVEPSDELYALVQDVLQAEAIAGGGVRIRCAVIEQEAAPASVEHVSPGASIRHFLAGEEAFRAASVRAEPDAIIELFEAEEAPDVLILSGFPGVVSDAQVAGALEGFVRQGGFLLVYGTEGLQGPEAGGRLPLEDILPASPGSGFFAAEGAGIERGERLVQILWHNHPSADFLETSGKPGAQALATSAGQALGWTWDLEGGTVAWYAVAGASAGDARVITWFLRGQTTQAAGGEQTGAVGLLARLIAHGTRERGQVRDMRGVWLVTLSLLVCVVGITNAMLMSVTERFREIGTMKCLGALDKFVVKLFLIESSLQGVFGSLVGAFLGFALSFVRATFTFHVKDVQTGEGYWLSLRYFPALDLLAWVSVALAIGVVLSIVAAIYPAIRAARMQPVQAMRGEA